MGGKLWDAKLGREADRETDEQQEMRVTVMWLSTSASLCAEYLHLCGYTLFYTIKTKVCLNTMVQTLLKLPQGASRGRQWCFLFKQACIRKNLNLYIKELNN